MDTPLAMISASRRDDRVDVWKDEGGGTEGWSLEESKETSIDLPASAWHEFSSPAAPGSTGCRKTKKRLGLTVRASVGEIRFASGHRRRPSASR